MGVGIVLSAHVSRAVGERGLIPHSYRSLPRVWSEILSLSENIIRRTLIPYLVGELYPFKGFS